MSDAAGKKSDRDPTPMVQSQSQFIADEASGAGPAAPVTARLLAGYQRSPAAFDELLGADATVRPHYAKLIGALAEFSPAELPRRSDTCNRLVHEQGITYNVYGDERGMERPWQLDPIPFIIAPEEWRTLEAGLVQRAMLLNKILADCYGAQELIRSRSGSNDRTLTSTLSPTDRTSLGWRMRPQEMSVMWSSPSIPPRSMKAPKSVMFLT